MTVTDRPPAEVEERLEPRSPAFEQSIAALPTGSRILHIGPHKTGTTAIQAALHAARPEIERQGLFYASEGRHAMTAALAALQLPNPWSDERNPPERWKWDRLLKMIRGSTADRVILSSEFYADGKPDMIRRVVDELDPARIEVLVTLRPVAKIMPSQWQQWVQNLWTTPLDQFVHDLLEKPEGTGGKLFWGRHRHDLLIKRWADIVGTDRVTAIALDDRDHGMVLRVFEQLTGLREGTLSAERTISNRSMTLSEIEVIRAFNKAYKREKLSRRLYTRVMRFGATTLMEARPPGPDEAKIELPAWAQEPVAEIARQIIDGIRASGVRVIGDLDALAAAPASAAPASAADAVPVSTLAAPSTAAAGPVMVSPEVAASAALGVLVASGLTRGTALVQEDVAGLDDGLKPLSAPPVVQEPVELLRMSSTQLQLVLVRRARAAALEKLRPVVRPLLFWRRWTRPEG